MAVNKFGIYQNLTLGNGGLSNVVPPYGFAAALLHKLEGRRDDPHPRRSFATGIVVRRPSCVKRLSKATHTCNPVGYFNSSNRLLRGDVLILDRGFPASWLVQALAQRGIDFVIRCDSTPGWGAARSFLRSDQSECWAWLPPSVAQQASM